jgi:hypothetical protein
MSECRNFLLLHSSFELPVRLGATPNFAWVQHFIHHLAPHGMAGFVLVRFWFWVKHGCHRTGSREETGHVLCEFNQMCGTRLVIRLASLFTC